MWLMPRAGLSRLRPLYLKAAGGRLDVLFNNAGVAVTAPFDEARWRGTTASSTSTSKAWSMVAMPHCPI